MNAEMEYILTQISSIIFQARTISTELPVQNLLDELLPTDDGKGLLEGLKRLVEE